MDSKDEETSGLILGSLGPRKLDKILRMILDLFYYLFPTSLKRRERLWPRVPLTFLPSRQIWGSCPLVKDYFNLFSFSSDFFVNTEHVSLFFSLNLKLHTVKSQLPCPSDSQRELCHKHGSGRTELKDPGAWVVSQLLGRSGLCALQAGLPVWASCMGKKAEESHWVFKKPRESRDLFLCF